MLGVFVSVLVLYVGAELLELMRAARAEAAAEEAARRDSAPRLLDPFHTSERARRAYAIRCSCDGRDQ
jgi:hypothetical protein